MKLIRGIHNLTKINSNSAVSIGNFDGIHLGHQKLLSNLYEVGKKYNIPTIVILFEPQPLEFLHNHNPPKRLTTLQNKIKYIQLWNIDIILCIKFNESFSSLSPEKFIKNILIKKLNIKFIIIGDDFRFGSKRNGNISLLKKIGHQYKFKVIEVSALLYKNKIKISSTNIRKYLLENKIELAKKLLGRPFSILSRVIHGNKIGRKLGYPTANIFLNKNIPLNNGVYAVKVSCLFNKNFIGICNVGIKPSFLHSKKNRFLEVYLFNFNLNLYGKKIEVFLHKKIRNESFFSSIEELKKQISKDIKIVKKYFNINDY
ncbi:bifunctional riboflavin kinase/FAD synthetase [Buchnera aphidicola]|uniref:Riboflavin biosynthesis protein n=1 Tax=Buchnera aphidicola subsp. Rhopalosiphum maidis TaxID=118109 RepID=A0A3G2I633_BUCRM|nr:bifunctional riboflavin kinase/FAD synthetase [Buchnera aphidicola]AYN24892.1 bifunctional riboflavin kinase/FAD synthetase [Buchnera aphidicola (Rhopalosiphum maidis)]